ncbi:MAG TPA: helix-turn-helix domain-containing protein [Thermoanaerobaculaceae bacterium]|nr:helix-turn-helix domain-containing protein [Thermoanaerobaculaceae bacterium]
MPAVIGPVHIAGGGVSGLATAVLLARQGAQVEVHDRHVGGGGRFHGGWQVLDNGLSPVDALEELHGLGLTGRPPVVPAHRAVLLDAFGGRHEVSSRAPFTYFLRRGGEGSLDAWLREQAIELGVTLREGCEAPGDAQVVATGPHRADGVAREVVFASDLPDTVMVLFDPNVTPSGYAYLFCLQGHATFGVAQVRCLRLLPAARQVAWVRFRRELGHTILDEIQRVRLGRVCMLLRETNQPIGEIIRTCGFDSESHVSTLFRRHFDCTMRHFRQNG